jgi:hypothetical protein
MERMPLLLARAARDTPEIRNPAFPIDLTIQELGNV